MNKNGKTCGSCACGDLKHLHVPPRGPFEALEALGARRTCVRDHHTVQLAVPTDWSIIDTSVSPFHKHLVDGEGKAIACLLHKPGSAGVGSFQISSSDNCAELARP